MAVLAMTPHGAALRAYQAGERAAELVMRREDGLEARLPAAMFFRSESEFTPIERAALERCRGHVLDVGAGAGQHTLALQARGLAVTALDICPEAVEVMRARGVSAPLRGDVFQYDGGPFDAILLLGNGIGMAGDLAGAGRLLAHAAALLAPGGRLLLHSTDVSVTTDPVHVRYVEGNRAAGRYPGETRLTFEYAGVCGPECGWLHVDPATLEGVAREGGWQCRVVLKEPSGEYLAELTRA